MHDIEPYWSWRELYIASEDERSPFYRRRYSEFEFSNTIYNYYIHPQWDFFGSRTLYLKILYTDYDTGFCILEFIGEWNDCLYNDIMFLKRNIIEHLEKEGIKKFILIGENVLNFHSSDDCYYQEWFEDIEDGWIAAVNFRNHVLQDFKTARIHYYITFHKELNDLNWRNYLPFQMFEKVESVMTKRLSF
ncbi:MAG TPA: hypothetical protein PKK00_06885 [Bacteroidales bacterium]|nr:hypothetical protein [Bacteroidales bacterium]HPS17039.1 hypothetical protein [Bacteroidales bacterium]